jgi:hypothetical protein
MYRIGKEPNLRVEFLKGFSLLFARKAKACPSEAPLRWPIFIPYNIGRAVLKHTILLGTCVNYGRKKFYDIWPRCTVRE